jgi:HlyD family secretion protein
MERGKAMWREVKLGLRGLETAEVAEGLLAGEVVCKPREANQPLTDGQRVTAAPKAGP